MKRILTIIKSGFRICSSRYLNIRYPVFLVFELTYRCDLQCLYCNRKDGGGFKEADTETICRIIAEGKKLGLLRAYFTGGSIFLRKDLGDIVAFCKKLGIMVELCASGTMVSDNADILRKVDCLEMSLDGPEATHDRIRGESSFVSMIQAAELAREYNIPVSLTFTHTVYNTEYFMEAASIALSLGATIGLQPTMELAGGKTDIKEIFPSKEEFNKVLNQAIMLKKKNPLLIENSIRHLHYLKSWPALKKFPCLHGRAIFTVLPDATLVACTNSDVPAPNSVDLKKCSLKDAISQIRQPDCNGCACFGAYDSGGSGSVLPVSREVFNFYILHQWRHI
ncbi:MAG: radical SAM protein [Candidatus Omnitrophica bacterium]|nr:radical SAM protein [Candidatus Omnitrophota bacterium]